MTVGEPIDRNKLLTGKVLNEAIKQASKPVSGGDRTSVTSTASGQVVTDVGDEPRRRVQWFGAIVDLTLVTPGRWLYTVRERIKTKEGYDGWNDKPNGREVEAFHLSEDMNDGMGIENHGINVDELTGSFATVPLPIGLPVVVTEVRLADGSTLEHWITGAMNGVDGACG